MPKDPFKLHPLPQEEQSEDWGDDALDLEDAASSPEVGLSLEEEATLSQEMVVHSLAREQLFSRYGDQASVDVLQVYERFSGSLQVAAARLRQKRDELALLVEVTDAGVEPEGLRRAFELRQLPLLIGRSGEPVHLALEDPEVAPLRGFFYQLGRYVVYQDLGGPGGTLLDRVVKGKASFIALKEEPCPILRGDRLVLGNVQTQVVIKEIFSAQREPAHPVLQGLAPTPEAPTQPRSPRLPAFPEEDTAPPPPRGLRLPYLGLGLVAAVGLFFLGRWAGSSPPPPDPGPATPGSTPQTAQVLPESRGLELLPDGSLHLASPALPVGSRFFVHSPLEQADKGQALPVALGEVRGKDGAASLLFALPGVPTALLSQGRVEEARADDGRVALFLALQALQAQKLEDASSLLAALTGAPELSPVVLKAQAWLAMLRRDAEGASRLVRQALPLAPTDPELQLLHAQLGLSRLATLNPTDARYAPLLLDVRARVDQALRTYLARVGAWSFQGRELGLGPQSIYDEFNRQLARVPASSPALTQLPPLTPPAPAAGALPGAVAIAPTPPPLATPVPEAPRPEPARGPGHVLVRVPEGNFVMGGGAGDATDEQGWPGPVRLKSFSIDKFEVSNAQLERVFPDHRARRSPGASDQDPATQVTWEEAQGYCRAVGMRLPTEAEWERAARGTDGRAYPWGDSRATPSLLNYRSSGLGRPAPVDSFPEGASPVGALNMAGNVWEWVADWYDPQYYRSAPASNPTGPSSGSKKVIRGGSFADEASDARASNRAFAGPGGAAGKIGFRCARD